MHTVVAVRKTEVDIPSAELDSLLPMFSLSTGLVVGIYDGRVIERRTLLALQYTTLQPHLIGSREHWHIIKQDVVTAQISKEQCTGSRHEERSQLLLLTVHRVKHDMLRRLVVDKVHEILIQFLLDMEALRHRLEDGIRVSFLIAAELHQTQQQE